MAEERLSIPYVDIFKVSGCFNTTPNHSAEMSSFYSAMVSGKNGYLCASNFIKDLPAEMIYRNGGSLLRPRNLQEPNQLNRSIENGGIVSIIHQPLNDEDLSTFALASLRLLTNTLEHKYKFHNKH